MRIILRCDEITPGDTLRIEQASFIVVAVTLLIVVGREHDLVILVVNDAVLVFVGATETLLEEVLGSDARSNQGQHSTGIETAFRFASPPRCQTAIAVVPDREQVVPQHEIEPVSEEPRVCDAI